MQSSRQLVLRGNLERELLYEKRIESQRGRYVKNGILTSVSKMQTFPAK